MMAVIKNVFYSLLVLLVVVVMTLGLIDRDKIVRSDFNQGACAAMTVTFVFYHLILVLKNKKKGE